MRRTKIPHQVIGHIRTMHRATDYLLSAPFCAGGALIDAAGGGVEKSPFVLRCSKVQGSMRRIFFNFMIPSAILGGELRAVCFRADAVVAVE